jgi:uncharacterized membrane protein
MMMMMMMMVVVVIMVMVMILVARWDAGLMQHDQRRCTTRATPGSIMRAFVDRLENAKLWL